MKDFFKIGIEGKEGEDKHYIKNAGWWIIHRPVQWFFWLGFVGVIALPMGITNAHWSWKQRIND